MNFVLELRGILWQQVSPSGVISKAVNLNQPWNKISWWNVTLPHEALFFVTYVSTTREDWTSVITSGCGITIANTNPSFDFADRNNQIIFCQTVEESPLITELKKCNSPSHLKLEFSNLMKEPTFGIRSPWCRRSFKTLFILIEERRLKKRLATKDEFSNSSCLTGMHRVWPYCSAPPKKTLHCFRAPLSRGFLGQNCVVSFYFLILLRA